MIFVTVGNQLPFNRLIQTVDAWAKSAKLDVFAQIGDSKFKPKHIEYELFLDSQRFEDKLQKAELVIAHAGMGTIITCLDLAKQIIVMPRLAQYKEHRNDHQLATARQFEKRGLLVAYDDKTLIGMLENYQTEEWVNRDLLKGKNATESLIEGIKQFITAN